MTYDQQILSILTSVGDKGISVMQVSKHVYNMNLSFFYTPDLNEIRAYVQQYLLKNSKSPQSLIESTGRRGYYRLNTQNNPDARQLMLEFGSSLYTVSYSFSSCSAVLRHENILALFSPISFCVS